MEGSMPESQENKRKHMISCFSGIFWGICSSCLGKDKSGGTQQTQVEELKLSLWRPRKLEFMDRVPLRVVQRLPEIFQWASYMFLKLLTIVCTWQNYLSPVGKTPEKIRKKFPEFTQDWKRSNPTRKTENLINHRHWHNTQKVLPQ